jgi:hypothetical protein
MTLHSAREHMCVNPECPQTGIGGAWYHPTSEEMQACQLVWVHEQGGAQLYPNVSSLGFGCLCPDCKGDFKGWARSYARRPQPTPVTMDEAEEVPDGGAEEDAATEATPAKGRGDAMAPTGATVLMGATAASPLDPLVTPAAAPDRRTCIACAAEQAMLPDAAHPTLLAGEDTNEIWKYGKAYAMRIAGQCSVGMASYRRAGTTNLAMSCWLTERSNVLADAHELDRLPPVVVVPGSACVCKHHRHAFCGTKGRGGSDIGHAVIKLETQISTIEKQHMMREIRTWPPKSRRY